MSELQNSSYNISINLSSIGSLFSYPSRLLSRIRGLDSDAGFSVTPIPVTAIDYSLPTPAPSPGYAPPPVPDVPRQAAPGPWGFFTSSYMIGLILMMVLMHRIENVVVPTRVPIPFHPRRRSGPTLLRRVCDAVLPFDMDRTTTRLALHLPTLYLMFKSLLLWTLLLLQATDLYPSIDNHYVTYMRVWSESQEMRDICWQTFCAICGAFCVEAFVKGLDGVSVGIGAHMQANTSPFNLVGYAFLLYAYSSSYTHVIKPDDLPSRPDKHVLISITIPLLQLTIFHLLSVRKRWSGHRLLPTALSSILSLIHFHSTLFVYALAENTSSSIPDGVQPPRKLYSSPAGIGHYPILNYIPNLFESVLLLLISLTIFLNTITQLLLTGKVTKPLLGLGLTSADGGPTEGWSWSPPWEEDFGVVLLRVGTASLEATGLRGWGNEVSGVVASLPSDMIARSSTSEKVERGTMKMNRNGVDQVQHGSVTTIKTSRGAGSSGLRVSKRIKLIKGLRNEIRDVHLVGNGGGLGNGRRVFGVPGFFTVNQGWYWGVRTLASTMWGVFVGFLGLIWDCLRGRKVRDRLVGQEVATEHEGENSLCDSDDEESLAHEREYEMFIRGEPFSDDEGDDGEWTDASEVGSDEEIGSDDTSDSEDERDAEAVSLYSDLQTRGTSPEAVSSAMLAHMAYGGHFPLTRRRYQALLAPPSSRTGESSFH
ncbi:hypothetical protein PQX77_003938 [Marasmius sp. AFHP31]|nr:hypothetical protein PQX77_003938 [Marasmius sp. AFHP31]